MPAPSDLAPPALDVVGRLLAEPRGGDNARPLSVSEISGALKRMVEGEFGHIRVRGELSGYKRAASGHCYCALKDDSALIDAVMWKGQAARIPFMPEDGLEVIVTGKLTTYPGRSKYQIVIETMELAGEGALMALFEKLKSRLRAEGLFMPERKRAIPLLPRTIGVVTSPTGAVIRDILHRLADRWPSHVLVWPVIVQGEGAAAQIASAVRGFGAIPAGGALPRPDLLIVARGGGSIEDLWAFNQEAVVRAIAASPIPVISAVGHETDTTLSDFAADLRAPTPTAAAEMAVPVRAEWQATLSEWGLRLGRSVRARKAQADDRLAMQARLLPRLPDVLRPHQQRLDEAGERLRAAMRSGLMQRGNALARASGGLRPALVQRRLEQARERLNARWAMVEQLHPDRPLQRGYVRLSGPDGAVIASKAAAQAAGRFAAHFADGVLPVQVSAAADGDEGASQTPQVPLTKPARAKPLRPKTDDRQERLF